MRAMDPHPGGGLEYVADPVHGMKELGNIGWSHEVYKPPRRPCPTIHAFISQKLGNENWGDNYLPSYPNEYSVVISGLKYAKKFEPTVNTLAARWATDMVVQHLAPAVSGWVPCTTNVARNNCIANSGAGLWPESKIQGCKRGAVLGGVLGTNYLNYLAYLEQGVTPPKPLWKTFIKQELLPKKKHSTLAFRTITSPPTDVYLAQVKFMGPFNDRLKKYIEMTGDELGLSLEFSPFKGGFKGIARRLPDGWVVSDEDGKEYDSSLQRLVRLEMLEIRLRTAGATDYDIEFILGELYRTELEGPIAFPNGQVFETFNGQKSGSFSTSIDNSVTRLWLLFYSWYRLIGPDVNIKDFVKWFILGDDQLLYIHPRFAEKFSFYARRNLMCHDLGVWTTQSCPDSRTLEGHTYLGFQFMKDPQGVIRPYFDGERILAAAAKPVYRTQIKFAPERLFSLSWISLYSTPCQGRDVYTILRELFAFVTQKYPAPRGMEHFPTKDDIEELWEGRESHAPGVLDISFHLGL